MGGYQPGGCHECTRRVPWEGANQEGAMSVPGGCRECTDHEGAGSVPTMRVPGVYRPGGCQPGVCREGNVIQQMININQD